MVALHVEHRMRRHSVLEIAEAGIDQHHETFAVPYQPRMNARAKHLAAAVVAAWRHSIQEILQTLGSGLGEHRGRRQSRPLEFRNCVEPIATNNEWVIYLYQ